MIEEKLKKLKYEFRPKSGLIRLIPISCLHIGHKKFNLERAVGFLEYIRTTPDTYALMVGDTTENVITETAGRQKGSIHDQVMGVEQQREVAIEMLKPLAQAKKILSWNESNHSLRSWYEAGFSVEKYIADVLGVPFFGTDALLELRVDTQTYFVHVTHGTGASTSIQSVGQKLERQAHRITNADVYIRGHHHKKLLFENVQIDAKTGKLNKKLLGATGCFMDYIDSYGHRAEMIPVVPGCIKIKLYADRWDIHGSI